MENPKTCISSVEVLREKTEKAYIEKKLETALFGGFEKRSVFRFLAELREEEQKTRKTFDERVRELNTALYSLRSSEDEDKVELECERQLRSSAEKELKSVREENAELKGRVARLSRENKELTAKLPERTAQLREGGMNTELLVCDYVENERYRLVSLIESVDRALNLLKEMDFRKDAFHSAVKENLSVLKCL